MVEEGASQPAARVIERVVGAEIIEVVFTDPEPSLAHESRLRRNRLARLVRVEEDASERPAERAAVTAARAVSTASFVWSTMKEAARYTRAATQRIPAESAMKLLSLDRN